MNGTPLTGWRKIANALWDAPSDPQIYGAWEVDATRMLTFIEAARARGGRVTPTHLVGRAVARALSAVPDLNVRFVGDRAIPREGIDVFFITAVASGRDLSGVKICHADRKNVLELSVELSERSGRMKAGKDPDFARSKRAFEVLPRPVLRVALRAMAWVTGTHATAVPALGLPASPFGSAMVTSVGMLGIPMGFAPLAWMYAVPLLVLVGQIAERPVVRGGRIEACPILPITATIDHRYADGSHLSEALKAFREYLEDPERFEPPADVA